MLVRKIALVLAVVAIATALAATGASAQIGPTNPSGGTGLRQSIEEGPGSFGPADIFAPGPSGWRTWLAVLGAYGSSTFATRSSDAGALLAVARRYAWRR